MGQSMEVADRYYSALSRNDAEAVAATFSTHCKVDVPGGMLEGPDQVKGWMKSFFDAFPDITHSHDEVKAEGDRLVTTVHVEGTHTAPLVSPQGEIPPTQKRIHIEAVNEIKVDADQIEEMRIDFDQGDFMRQLGLG